MRTSQKGFTVIEFIIVFAIIGIVAAIAIPVLKTAREADLKDKVVNPTPPDAGRFEVVSKQTFSEKGTYLTTIIEVTRDNTKGKCYTTKMVMSQEPIQVPQSLALVNLDSEPCDKPEKPFR